MATRSWRGSGLGRAARGRAGLVALACALFVAAGLITTWPGVRHLDTSFMAEGKPGYGEAAPGDHLQTSYNLWLVGHQLEHGHAPWRDPFSFQPEVKPRWNFAGWPFGWLYRPLLAILGQLDDRGRDVAIVLDQLVEHLRSLLAASLGSGDTDAAGGLSAAAHRLAAIDPERRGVGGLRFQLELALLDAATRARTAG